MDFPALITFLSKLALNNDKPWFEEHRPTYERLRGEWLTFVGQVIDGISQFDPSVGIVSPKDALFRINRDVRFSKDKRPYKTTFSAAICPQGRNSGLPAYYFQINEAGALFIGGGVYMPEPTILGQIRQHIAEHPERMSAVLADPAFAARFGTIEGERLKRPPQGYDETTPGIEFIKLKSFTVGIEPSGWLTRGDNTVDEIVGAFRAMFPLIGWLRAALTGSRDLGYLSPQEIDRLVDGMLLLDPQDRVVDLNPAARRLLEPLPTEPIGRHLEETLQSWPELLAAMRDPPLAHTTVSRGAGPDADAYAVSISPLIDPHGQPAGRLVAWHDVTILRRQEEVAQQRQALATLAERDRLGKELHDGLGQTLGFVSVEAQAARDALSRGQDALADSYLARIVSVTQEAHSDVREFLLGVRTGDTSSLGFFRELEGYLARHRRQHALQVMLDRPSSLTDDAIEPAAQAQLLRIIQEALANVRQHAAATEVRITVVCEGDAIHVTIADNGQGLDPAALLDRQGGHYGLRFMQERAEEVGGALQVETAPGRGVEVCVRVPARRTEGARP